jgi:lysyl-tRNA synthetase class 2
VLDAEPRRVSVAGRLMSKRVMGKASFAHVMDMSGRISATRCPRASTPSSRPGTSATSSVPRGCCSRPAPASCRSRSTPSAC